MNREELKKILTYDSETGVFTRVTWVDKAGVKRGGRKIGGLNLQGYIQATILGHGAFLMHRVAWLYFYGSWPIGQIDHINRDRADNRICNLRDCTHLQNMKNTKLSKNNKSGYKGVFEIKESGKWVAYITHKYKRKHLGYFSTAKLASEAYKKAAKNVSGDFYSE